ncbi:gamma-glutamylcyclotransferase [Marininema halotolerans]|uniref:Uncharacterized conserved protein YtfP, gamma-glutamylcyclotransferase (GGCT)/AIG2-like family n=1 Tax=Marininema halotolerans TaxID=1155944 RepID=A0A1I6SM43_9BACL|nr:gamma-glutamylcyclotransferase family protein [Marininema halotolerans]SFS78032.1 Uncharacterized conserved protein YtfP, gamma-glutamylcyclotransferase (GGCT)/AIG2-like family [Marininema halotolerans]
MVDESILLFVYGTLLRGEAANHYLKDAEPIAMQAWVEGALYDMKGKYPALLPDPSKKAYGEVYRVSKSQLARVDQWEDYQPERENNLFVRRSVRVGTDQGAWEAETYFYGGPREVWMSEIPSGDWRTRLLQGDQFYYFAYGSCMDNERFIAQGVGEEFSRVKGGAVLKGYAMRYTLSYADGGRADIVEDPQDTVEGKVYQITHKGLEYLLWREGVHQQTYRPVWIPIELQGKLYAHALSFTVVNKQREVAPPDHYAREILRGAKGTVTEAYYQRLCSDLTHKFKMEIPTF